MDAGSRGFSEMKISAFGILNYSYCFWLSDGCRMMEVCGGKIFSFSFNNINITMNFVLINLEIPASITQPNYHFASLFR